jgi:hypothetical protein
MPIYWVTSYYIAPGKGNEYQKWLNSDEAKKLFTQFEKETGFKHFNTYMALLGFGDYDCEDWYVAPDWAAFDKNRASKAFDELNVKTWDFCDQTRSMKSRVMRTAQETMISEKPAKKR